MIDRQQAHSLGRPSGRPGWAFFLPLNKDDDQFDESTSGAAKLFGVTAAQDFAAAVVAAGELGSVSGAAVGGRLMQPVEKPATELAVVDVRRRPVRFYPMSFVERNNRDLMETLFAVNLTLFREYRYVPGSTGLETTPYELLISKHGNAIFVGAGKR